MGLKKAIFLDRDGTIVVERDYIRDPKQVELIPGAGEAINGFHSLGFLAVLVTNQSAVARGYITEERLIEINKRMESLLSQEGAFLDAIYFCPHHPDDGCYCRKPMPGLLKRAYKDLNIDRGGSFVIGDMDCDIGLGKREGIKTILVLTGHGRETLKKTEPDYVVDNILEAGRLLEKIIR